MIFFVLGFIAAIIIVVLFLWAAGKENPSAPAGHLPSSGEKKLINPEQVEKRRENLEKVMHLAREKGKISNDDVQFALQVSDATATRYLEELERQGKLVQTGSGKAIIYRLTPGHSTGQE